MPLLCRYSEMPKVIRASARVVDSSLSSSRAPRGTLGQYFATQHCPVCEQLTLEGVCAECRTDPCKVALTLTERARQDELTCKEIVEVSLHVDLYFITTQSISLSQ